MPAYNEEPSIESAALKVVSVFGALGLDWELVIVDDNSRDRTAEIARAVAAQHPEVRLVKHSQNQGIGGAFRTGVQCAVKDFVMLVPVDNPLDLAEIEVFLPRMATCDIVIGVRAERIGYNWFARFASFTYNRILIPLLFNVGVSDVNWITVYRRSIFSSGGVEIKYSGIFFFVEILVRARRKLLVLAEVPATMRRRLHGKASSARLSVMWRTFWDMIGFFISINRGTRQP